MIAIRLSNGYIIRYLHLSEIYIRTGEKVFKGQVIGRTGDSFGKVASHLHIDYYKNNLDERIDPLGTLFDPKEVDKFQQSNCIYNIEKNKYAYADIIQEKII